MYDTSTPIYNTYYFFDKMLNGPCRAGFRGCMGGGLSHEARKFNRQKRKVDNKLVGAKKL